MVVKRYIVSNIMFVSSTISLIYDVGKIYVTSVHKD